MQREKLPMRNVFLPIAVLLFLAGCAGPTRVDVAAGGPGYDYYDGYYDGAYGPFVDGYWGDDGAFWYQGGDHAFHRDDAHHFQHTAGSGFNHVHGTGMHRDH